MRLLAHSARWILRVVLAVWLIFLLAWGGLHLIIVPRIPQWAAHLERWASQAVGAPVRIGQIRPQAGGLFPTLELRDVQLLDAAQRPGVGAAARGAHAVAQALLRGGLEQLYIEAPSLEISRLADGRWRVAGLDAGHRCPRQRRDPRPSWLLEQPELVVRGGQLHWVDALRGQDLHLTDVDVVLRGGYWHHALAWTRAMHRGRRCMWPGRFRRPVLPGLPGSAPLWQRWSGQWFAQLQLQQLPLIDWPAAWGITAAQGQGQVRAWVDVVRGQPVGTTADVALPRSTCSGTRLPGAPPPLQLHQVQGRLAARWQHRGAAWAVQAQQLGFAWQAGPDLRRRWMPSDWSVESVGQASDGAGGPWARTPNICACSCSRPTWA